MLGCCQHTDKIIVKATYFVCGMRFESKNSASYIIVTGESKGALPYMQQKKYAYVSSETLHI